MLVSYLTVFFKLILMFLCEFDGGKLFGNKSVMKYLHITFAALHIFRGFICREAGLICR